MENWEIVIVGGGICGLATALGLHRRGIKSLVLERSESLRASGTTIVIQTNGWHALDHLEVGSQLRDKGLLLSGLRDIEVETSEVREVLLGMEVRCLKRSDLIEALAKDLPVGTIRFGSHVMSITTDPFDSFHELQLSDGSTLKAKVLIGCDGVNSVVLNYLGMNPIRVTTTACIRGFTSYPNGHMFGNKIVKAKRREVLLGAIPVNENLVYWFLVHLWTSQDPEISKDQDRIKTYGLKYIEGFPEEMVEMVKMSDPALLYNMRLKYRAPWELFLSSCMKGTATVGGDALHAMTPFNAQGGASSLEDAVVLARALAAKVGTDRGHVAANKYKEALATYLNERRMRIFKLCSLSYILNKMIETSSVAVTIFCVLLKIAFFRNPLVLSEFNCGDL